MQNTQYNKCDKYTYGKDLITTIEENIDEYIFFEFMSTYRTLIQQMRDVDDGMKSTAHQLLMDYLSYKLDEARDEHLKEKLGADIPKSILSRISKLLVRSGAGENIIRERLED